ncbi:hypothetical protein BDA96_05G192200 [Sorghum bicolor]|uniref:Rx N-terminal domain-containing protein n=1 Tax=Sorghum bicolor TaxID=4558 RepID=A0A921QY46_SORBI|nr:hypothetical protein BDA96_05G192200 [Sorghum bicolor]
MAELAAGAVNSLLGLIRNEALLLSRVRGDVRFIKDEMESMKSFLAHLARTRPPGGKHDEQVLTWMKQVEELAHDCRDSVIVLYLHRGDPEMVDQHRAASRLVELKERARDVSERRKRYDVEVPTKPSSSQAWSVASTGALEYEEDDSDNEASSMSAADDDCRRRLLEPPSPVDYCTLKLADWLNKLRGRTNMEGSVASIAIVAPDEDNMAHTIVNQAVAMTSGHFRRIFWIHQNQAGVHYSSCGIPVDILLHVLRKCKKEGTSSHLSDVQSEISRKIEEMDVDSKIRNIVAKIEELDRMIIGDNENNKTEQSKIYGDIPLEEPLGMLQQALTTLVFPASRRKQPAQVKEGNARTTLVQDETNDFEEEAIKSSVNNQAFGILGGAASGIPNKSIAAAIRETKDNLEAIKRIIKEQMWIKEIVGKIELKYEDTAIVLQDETDYISRLEEIMNALSLLARTSCLSIAVVMVRRKSQRAIDYCYLQGGPIEYPLVESYHKIVLQLTREPRSEDDKKKPRVLLGILEKCDPDEFCMKMLAHALYANPNRSYSELLMLHEVLDLLKDSMGVGATSNFKKMFKFSYNDLPKDYKSCLLYLAIFPQGCIINRATIVGRWVTEGLIQKEDWCTSVDHADACFSTLINRWFICAADIGAAEEVKSGVVGGQVHGIISKIARKERILDTRLSYHLAHHFSIFSGLQLRRSDSIQSFVHKLPEYSPQLPLVKVLHLEGCRFLEKNHSYLKNICNKMLLLKCLSLKGTDVTYLPREINNLHELEILDIRQTRVPVKETRNVLLLKLRRLLAGDTDSSASSNGIGTASRKQKSAYTSCVRIPYRIEKMQNLEVLSNVIASLDGNDLKDTRKLWQLRELGVVINDNDKHLFYLLQAIGDLKESLQSISITIAETRSEDHTSDKPLLPKDLYIRLSQPSKVLESISINGYTNKVRPLGLLAKGSSELDKVDLGGTMLKQVSLVVLYSLPKLCCIRLRDFAYNDPMLIFNKEEFEHLKCLFIDGHNMTDINFAKGAAVALEKIVLSSTNIKSLRGVGQLPMLKELELKGNELFDSFSEEGAPQESTEPKITARNITFKKEEFQHLKYFHFEDTRMIHIIFEYGAAPELEKIILCMSSTESKLTVSGSLPKLREIKVKGDKSIFLSLFFNASKINTVTLCDTLFNKGDDLYKVLSCSKLTNIKFNSGSCPGLEKIIWFHNDCAIQISGMDNIGKLKELELNGNYVPHQLRKDIEAHKNKPVLRYEEPQHKDDKADENKQGAVSCLPHFTTNYFSKKKDQC